MIADELHGRQTLGIEHGGEFLDLRRFRVNPIRFAIAKDKKVDEASRVIALLPNLVAQGPRLARADVRDKLANRRETALQGFRAHLVTRELPNLLPFTLMLCHV